MRKSDIIIIGSGPAGMEAAARAIAAGRDTVIIERDLLGGTCLNRGCIPTKALCRSAETVRTVREASRYGVDVGVFTPSFLSALERKDAIVAELRGNVESMLSKAEIVHGEARFVASDTVVVDNMEYTAPMIVIATGSKASVLPVAGAEHAVTSDGLLSLESVPESICIIGGGVIGVEFACILAEFGVKVTVVEYCREILPGFDRDIAKRLHNLLSRRGIDIITSAAVTGISVDGSKCVEYTYKGRTEVIEAEEVLMAAGRSPVIPDGVADLGIEVRRGITVNDSFATSVPGVYAVGDANGRLMLAHAASAQAACLMGANMNLSVIPAAVFSSPECAMVGLTEEACKEQGMAFKSVKAMFRSNGKAMAMGETDGLVKIIVNPESRLILGCHICGPHASDLVQEVAVAMSGGLTIDVVADTVHAHPTLGEVIWEAARSLG
ncbi:MAG: dihydrolipoyl dehydrogenase [Muribaculum sp.]